MANCKNCSAPLLANINRCQYCGVRNDVDLHGKHDFSITTQHSDRICPQCDAALETICLDLKEPFFIERCKSCYGLFFDPGEIETLLESSVSNVFNINLEYIDNINNDRYQKSKKVKYVPCPVCKTLMNRVNYKHRSGVVIDQCSKHGVWLDNGEITHLMEWKKAGGDLLDAKKKKEKITIKKPSRSPAYQYDMPDFKKSSDRLEVVLFEAVSALVYKLFS
jgi:Zn-finger nucleic acid-binding protein